MSFALVLIIVFLVACVCLVIGYAAGQHNGEETGWNAGYDFANSTSEIRWQITARGAECLERSERPDLKLHENFKTLTSHADDR